MSTNDQFINLWRQLCDAWPSSQFMRPELVYATRVEAVDLFSSEELIDMAEEIEDARYYVRLQAPGYIDCTDWTPCKDEQATIDWLLSEAGQLDTEEISSDECCEEASIAMDYVGYLSPIAYGGLFCSQPVNDELWVVNVEASDSDLFMVKVTGEWMPLECLDDEEAQQAYESCGLPSDASNSWRAHAIARYQGLDYAHCEPWLVPIEQLWNTKQANDWRILLTMMEQGNMYSDGLRFSNYEEINNKLRNELQRHVVQ